MVAVEGNHAENGQRFSSMKGPRARAGPEARPGRAGGKYVGRPENKRRNARIAAMLTAGTSYTAVQEATGCSRATVAKIAKRQPQAA
jgi:DNA invertase Pin-like site-specific DNA recombinase